jgi:thioredoxin 1
MPESNKNTIMRITVVGLIIIIAVGIFIYKNHMAAQDNLDANLELDQNLPTLLEMSSTTCPPCREMIPILEELQAEYEGKVDIKIVDIDEYPDEANKYSIIVIPTQILLDVDGNEVGRHEGYIPKEDLIKVIEEKMGVV